MFSDNDSYDYDSDDSKSFIPKDVNNIFSLQKLKQFQESWKNGAETKEGVNNGNEKELTELMNFLNISRPHSVHKQLCHLSGSIVYRLNAIIDVLTKYDIVTFELDTIEVNFDPKEGDEVNLLCVLQFNEPYDDEHVKVLEVKKMFPTYMKRLQDCTVERVFDDIIVLTDNTYVLKEDLPNGAKLHLGDVVRVDLIESKYSKYTQRAIKLTQLEKNFGQLNGAFHMPASGNYKAVSIEGKEHFVYTELWRKHNVSFKVKNLREREVVLYDIEMNNPEDSQIRLMEPLMERTLSVNEQMSMTIEIRPRCYGESKELFTLHFDTFNVAHSITVVVCKSENEANEAKLRLSASTFLMNINATDVRQRSRLYTYKTFSQKLEVIPGESLCKGPFASFQLPDFKVPEKMYEIVLTADASLVKERLLAEYPFLTQKLSFENYEDRFSTLLHLEEIEWNIAFRNYDRERAQFNRDGNYLSLSIENLADRRPSIAVGDTVNAIDPWANLYSMGRLVYQGFVHKVFCNRIYLKFNEMFQKNYGGEDYHLEFHFSRFGICKQHHAIGNIGSRMVENFLFPRKVLIRKHLQLNVILKDDNMYVNKKKLSWFNRLLNSIQKMAVYNILRGEAENMPYIIFGPPGTGKTVTLVEAVLQLLRNLPNARLLVGTPSNSAADLITKRIIDSHVVTRGELVRLVAQNQVEKGLIPKEYASYYATTNMGTMESSEETMILTDTGLRLRCQAAFLLNRRIIISTCSTLGSVVKMDFPYTHFTHVLIDEAGQCTEPEIMGQIVLLHKSYCQVVLAGDPHQLQPIVNSRYANEFGLGISFLARLFQTPPYRKDVKRFPKNSGYNPILLTKLLNNYRSLPSMMIVYSKLFYDNELIPMVSDHNSRESRLLAKLQRVFRSHPGMPRTNSIFFHGIIGENVRDEDSTSWYNLAEAREIHRFTIHLCRRRNILPEQIGILSPYAKQVKTLRNMFLSTKMTMPKIGSVEEFQGQERDIMLISTVRSSDFNPQSDINIKLGFLQCRRRMNVAISRARCLMVIFGNPYLLSLNACWRYLILYCVNNNAFFGCDAPPFLMEERKKEVSHNDEWETPI